MKKTTTIFAVLLISTGLFSQITPGKAMYGNNLKSKNDKVIMSGDEALSHLMANPNPTTSNQKISQGSEVIIGTTTYDLQSNAAIQNRIAYHDDGTISAGWTISQQYSSSYSDRGTGYNFFDGTSWSTNPTNRIESSRGGWPSIITMGSGKEASITHNTTNSHLNMTHRETIGNGNWSEQNVSIDSLGNSRYLIWNRSAVGGVNKEIIHMIAVTASTNFGGTPFNGLDGALVYYRSQDEGVTWDQQEVQLPTLDTTHFNSMSGDTYAIAANDETVVIAYFDDWGDSFILKSIDNGNNWIRTTFLNFPVDKYTMDDGMDLDGNDTTDHVFSTDNYGALILDANNNAHVFYGAMQYADDDLTDAGSSWYPSTNMLAYWNESFGPDTTDATLKDTVNYSDASGIITPRGRWYSDMMNNHIITAAPDLNGDSIVSGVDSVGGYSLYYASRASMPSAGISANGDLYLSFSAYTENADDGTQVFRHIYIIKSTDNGITWSNPIDVTPHSGWSGTKECVFGSMAPNINDKIRIIYQNDFAPGLAVRGDEDLIEENDIIYLEININEITSIADISTPVDFILFPNPTNSLTTITISLEKTEKVLFTVIDLLGKEIFRKTKIIPSGISAETLDVSTFENGIYFLSLKIGNQLTTRKLIVTK